MSHDSSTIEPEPHVHEGEARRFNTALWTGLYIGALLIAVMFGALVAANRIPRLDRYALERNAASYGAFLALMLVPIVVYLKRPLQLFISAIVAWVLFVGAYNLAGFYFRNLFGVLRTPFVALTEGAVLYGVTAVLCWVTSMAFHARRHTIAPRRRRAQQHAAERFHR